MPVPLFEKAAALEEQRAGIHRPTVKGFPGGVCHQKAYLVSYVCGYGFTVATSCSDNGKTNGVSFEAAVLENSVTGLLVQPVEGSPELGSADKIVVFAGDAELVNAGGQQITIDDIEVGSRVRIFYSGGIAESHPAQINSCYKVVVLD